MNDSKPIEFDNSSEFLNFLYVFHLLDRYGQFSHITHVNNLMTDLVFEIDGEFFTVLGTIFQGSSETPLLNNYKKEENEVAGAIENRFRLSNENIELINNVLIEFSKMGSIDTNYVDKLYNDSVISSNDDNHIVNILNEEKSIGKIDLDKIYNNIFVVANDVLDLIKESKLEFNNIDNVLYGIIFVNKRIIFNQYMFNSKDSKIVFKGTNDFQS